MVSKRNIWDPFKAGGPLLRCCCAALQVGATLLTTLSATQGVCTTRSCPTPLSKRPKPASAAFSCPEPEFLLAAHVPVNSCAAPRRHGRITHQPEDVWYGGWFGPDLPCYPPLSHKSLRFEVGGCSSGLLMDGQRNRFLTLALLVLVKKHWRAPASQCGGNHCGAYHMTITATGTMAYMIVLHETRDGVNLRAPKYSPTRRGTSSP